MGTIYGRTSSIFDYIQYATSTDNITTVSSTKLLNKSTRGNNMFKPKNLLKSLAVVALLITVTQINESMLLAALQLAAAGWMYVSTLTVIKN